MIHRNNILHFKRGTIHNESVQHHHCLTNTTQMVPQPTKSTSPLGTLLHLIIRTMWPFQSTPRIRHHMLVVLLKPSHVYGLAFINKLFHLCKISNDAFILTVHDVQHKVLEMVWEIGTDEVGLQRVPNAYDVG